MLKLEWSEWCVWIKHAQTINFDSKLKNSATIWLRLVFVIIENVQMSLGLLLLLSLRKEENRFCFFFFFQLENSRRVLIA